MTEAEKQELRKSRVRVVVTYVASLFLFGGAAILMIVKPAEAKDIFFTVVPVATGIISYWFATRGKGSESLANTIDDARNGKKPQSRKEKSEQQV